MLEDQKDFVHWQQQQFKHDQRNHSDIICLHKNDRLKHYGLHFAKYVGRLVRGSGEQKPMTATVTDCALVSLSAANTLGQKLTLDGSIPTSSNTAEPALSLADAAGRFCDACEKIDHLEPFLEQARDANQEIWSWVVISADRLHMDLSEMIASRRIELKERQFFVAD